MISELTSQQSIDSEPVICETRSVNLAMRQCRDEFEKISDHLFTQIFSQDYLREPFKFSN